MPGEGPAPRLARLMSQKGVDGGPEPVPGLVPGSRHDDKTTTARPNQPAVCCNATRSPESLLCAFCTPLGELCVESRWLGRHQRCGLGALLGTPLFVATPLFPTQSSPSGAQSPQSRDTGDLWWLASIAIPCSSGPGQPNDRSINGAQTLPFAVAMKAVPSAPSQHRRRQ